MIRNFTIVIIASIVVLVSCFSNESKYVALRVRGSDSEVNLVQSIAENFMDQDSLVSVGVTGGGSGAGIAALINNKTDIANSSRAITDEEITIAKERGVHPYEIIFAQDVLAIILNESNPIQSLTLEQLGKSTAVKSATGKSWAATTKRLCCTDAKAAPEPIYFSENLL